MYLYVYINDSRDSKKTSCSQLVSLHGQSGPVALLCTKARNNTIYTCLFPNMFPFHR